MRISDLKIQNSKPQIPAACHFAYNNQADGNFRGRNWIRPGSLKWKWRAVVGQLATLIADHNVKCRGKPRPGWLVIGRHRLRAFAGETQKLVANSGPPSVTPGTLGVKQVPGWLERTPIDWVSREP